MRAACLFAAFLSLTACDQGARLDGDTPQAVAPLDLNAATVKQLEALPAIGPRHARSIIASRNARGGRFRSLDDLLAIDGIGHKTIEEIRPYVVVSRHRE